MAEEHRGVWSEELRERLVGGSGDNTARCIAEWVGLPASAAAHPRRGSPESSAVIDELGVEPMPGAHSLAVAVARSAGRGVQHAPAHGARDARRKWAPGGLRRPRLHAIVKRRPKPAPDVYVAACDALGVPRATPSHSRDSPPGLASRARRRNVIRRGASPGVREVEADLVLGSLLDLGSRRAGAVSAVAGLASCARPTSCAERSTPSRRPGPRCRRPSRRSRGADLPAGRWRRGDARRRLRGGGGSPGRAGAHDALGRPRRAAIGDCGQGTFWWRPPRPSAWRCSRRPSATRAARLRRPRRPPARRPGPAARHVLVAPGGSATVDGSLGMLAALGARVPGANGAALLGELELDLEPGAGALRRRPADRPARCRRPASAGPDARRSCSAAKKGLRPEDVEPFDRGLARFGTDFGGGDVACARGPARRAGSGRRSTRWCRRALPRRCRDRARRAAASTGRFGPLPDGGGVGRPRRAPRQDRRRSRSSLHGGRRALRRPRRARERGCRRAAPCPRCTAEVRAIGRISGRSPRRSRPQRAELATAAEAVVRGLLDPAVRPARRLDSKPRPARRARRAGARSARSRRSRRARRRPRRRARGTSRPAARRATRAPMRPT